MFFRISSFGGTNLGVMEVGIYKKKSTQKYYGVLLGIGENLILQSNQPHKLESFGFPLHKDLVGCLFSNLFLLLGYG